MKPLLSTVCVGKRNEIARPAARVGRNEQAARLRFEQGHLDSVADADLDLWHRAVAGAEGSQQRTWAWIGDQWQDVAVQFDKGILQN